LTDFSDFKDFCFGSGLSSTLGVSEETGSFDSGSFGTSFLTGLSFFGAFSFLGAFVPFSEASYGLLTSTGLTSYF
jgi:hypothetical protein